MKIEVCATEGARLRKGKKTPNRTGKLRPGCPPMKTKGPQKLLSDAAERKYQGKFVAISSKPGRKVVASADTYSALVAKAAKNAFFVLFVPIEGVLYSH